MTDTDFIDAISAHVLEKNAPARPVVVSGDKDRANAALAIYRNNVRMALSRALSDTYPVVERLVGGDFFKAMAQEYFHAGPPASPMIVDYARGFADFIDRFAPADTVPYLGDVARLEWAWLEAYRAADAEPLCADEIIAAGGADPSALRFQFHPSFRLLSSAFAVHSIWRRNRPGGEDTPIDMNDGEDILIVRPRNNVEVITLARGAMAALRALQHGESVEVAFERASTPAFDPQALFSLILSAGLVIGATTENLTEG